MAEAGARRLRGRLLRGPACPRPWSRGSRPFLPFRGLPFRRWTVGLLRRCLRRSVGGDGHDDGIRGDENVGRGGRGRGRGRDRGHTTGPNQSLPPRDHGLLPGEEDGEVVRHDEEAEAARDATALQRGSRPRMGE